MSFIHRGGIHRETGGLAGILAAQGVLMPYLIGE
jgi:hypothetical protein